ncbi:MAG: DUF1580 domain-containing protein [Planctomycetota bacterium]|nr:MAG: DUF1580 domain-containing protein [Planctomycetota bacterium]
MIKLSSERLLSLTEAARRLPCRRAGRPTHPSTLRRWAVRGLRGVQLETLAVGGSLCTSLEALQRFFERLGADSETSEGRSEAPHADGGSR